MSEGIECTVDVYQKQHRPCNCKQLDVGPCNRRSQKANYKAQLFNFGIHRVEISICHILVIGLTREDSIIDLQSGE